MSVLMANESVDFVTMKSLPLDLSDAVEKVISDYDSYIAGIKQRKIFRLRRLAAQRRHHTLE